MKKGIKNSVVALGIFGISLITTGNVFAGYFNSTPVTQCQVQITHTLQVGSSISDVYTLQEMLSRASYLHVAPNGYFGPSTKQAVMNFQRDNGISATGYVGESTMNAINERLCDNDPRGDSLSYYGYSSTGVTYVDQYDPYAVVVSPQVSYPAIYSTPQARTTTSNSYTTNGIYTPTIVSGTLSTNSSFNPSTLDSIVPATSQIQGTSIVYSPTHGYTYGISQQSGSLTITSPVVNSIYNEGDTVTLVWSTNNLNASAFQILLENSNTSQSRVVIGSVSGSSASFVLTKELLDQVCSTSCNTNQQGSFRIVMATPITDIAGITSAFRAAIAPITIKRPFNGQAIVSITASKTPINSGESFRLFVNTPVLDQKDTQIFNDAVVKVRATCFNNIQVNIAGVPCGQDFTIPLSALASGQGIPTMVTNTTWYKQDITVDVSLLGLQGQLFGTGRTTFTVNSAPFSW